MLQKTAHTFNIQRSTLNPRSVFHTIFKQCQPTLTHLAASVTGMLPGVDVILRVRHQPKNVSRRVADAGDVEYRAVGVGGVLAIGGNAIGVGIGQGDLVLGSEIGNERLVIGLEVAFAVGNGTGDEFIKVASPDALLGNGL
jgi:hypothetical protein